MRQDFLGKRKKRQGFSLLEVAMAMMIISVLAVSVSGAMVASLQAAGTSSDRTIAIQILTEQMELIRSQAIGNFDSVLPAAGTVGVIAIPVSAANYPNSRLVDRAAFHIDVQRLNVPVANNPDLIEVTGTISWRSQNNRLYGEDANLNGSLDLGEDLNGDGVLTSPVQITTRFSRR